jgi:hypothetical protein
MALSIDKAIDNAGRITGDIFDNGATDDATPTLVGTATAGSGVTINNQSGATLGLTIADPQGNWNYTLATQTEGAQTYVATASGGADVSSFALTIDLTPDAVPAIGRVTDDVGLVQGQLTAGQRIDDTTPTLQGGGAVFGDTINVYDNGQLLGTTAVKLDGSWLFTPISTLLEGGHALTVSSVDAVGNESAPSAAFNVTVDTIAPTAVATISAISTDTGTNGDFVTSDNTLVISTTVAGTINPDERVQISIDNGQTWHETTAAGGGVYQYDAQGTTLAVGSYNFEARVIDEAGNTGVATSQTVVINNTPVPPPPPPPNDCQVIGHGCKVISCDISLDLHNLKGCDQVNLGAKGCNTLNIGLKDVLQTHNSAWNPLTICGDKTDTVKLSASDGFTHSRGDVEVHNGVVYDVWHAGSGHDVATMLIQQTMHVLFH